MQRETKKIKTPVGNQEIELYTWLTGGEKRSVTTAIIENTVFSPDKLVEGIQLSGDAINKAQDVALKTVVVSIDGDTEKVLDKILNMRSEDFDFIVNEVNKITGNQVEDNIKKN